MKAQAFLLAAGVLLASVSQANTNQQVLKADCNGELGQISFDLNLATNTVTFTNVQALGGAQIAKNTPIGASISARPTTTKLNLEYNWYYVATYELTLDKSLAQLDAGSTVGLSFTGDDRDGAFFENEKFMCVIK